jgi:ATP-dependent DNA helicase RecG
LIYFDQLIRAFETHDPPYQTIEGIHRTTKERIARIAFREAVTNARILRDYMLNSGMRIAVFENRIEITMSGGLSEGMDEERFFKGLTSLSEKQVIANLFSVLS